MAISTSLGLAGVSSNLHWKKQQKWFKKITLWNSWMMLERYQLFLLSKPLHLDVLGDFAGMESCEVQREDDPYPETKKSVSRNVYLHILDCQNCSVPPYLQKKRWHVNNPNSPPPPLPPSKTNKNRKQISIRLNQPHHPNHTIPTPCSIHLNPPQTQPPTKMAPSPSTPHWAFPAARSRPSPSPPSHAARRAAKHEDRGHTWRRAEACLRLPRWGGFRWCQITGGGEKKTENAAVFLLGILIGILISDKKGYPHSIVWVFGDWNLWMYKIYYSIVNCMICVFRWESVLHENYYILWI